MNNLITLKYEKRQITDFMVFDKRLKVKLVIWVSRAFSITQTFRGRVSQTSILSRVCPLHSVNQLTSSCL